MSGRLRRLAAIFALVVGFSTAASANFITNTLGPAANFAILGLQGSDTHLSSGPLVVNGNIGVGPNATFKMDGGGTINGTVFFDPTATVTDTGNTITGGNVSQNMAAVQSAALNAASVFSALSPTQTVASAITSTTTITGNGGQNVIALPNGFQLSNGSLTFSGGPNDIFVIKIGSESDLSGGAQILLNGVQPNQIVFDFTFSGTWALQQSSNGAILNGYFLAPNAGFNINGSNTTADTAEFITGTTQNFQSNPKINQIPTPEPSSGILLGISLLAVSGVMRRRSKRT